MKIHLTLSTIILLLTTSAKGQDNVDNQYRNKIVVDTFLVSLGDKVYLDCDLDGQSISNIKKVATIADPSKTIKVEYNYTKGFGSVLTINNPFPKTLTYKVVFYSSNNVYAESIVYRVREKIGSKEIWTVKIETVGLTEFKLVEKIEQEKK
ncbi:hypothetical protein JYU20_02400 [Bacteroidales bacterium AH-315-I05]|nr:hypothetical protein [Bacteroidales bacterium AH-315-I05]